MRDLAKRRFVGLSAMGFLAVVQIIVLVSSTNLVHQIVGGIGLLTVASGTAFMLDMLKPVVRFGRAIIK